MKRSQTGKQNFPNDPHPPKTHPRLRRIGHVTFTMIAGLFFFFGALAFVSARWMLSTWANLDMAELVYHLTSPLEGTSTDLIYSYIFRCALPAVAALGILILLMYLLRHKKWSWILLTIAGCLAGCGILCYSALLVYNTLDVGSYLKNQGEYSTFMEDNYVNPASVSLTFPEQKRNLIYIFLESMESTYADQANGGAYTENYIPELTKLAEDNINFSNSDKLGGAYPTVYATWTMAGIFAQTSGIPLKTSIRTNEMAYQTSFFPQLTTLGDILEEQGYRQEFLLGSDVTFGGRKNYFTQHGNFSFCDYYWAVDQGLIDQDYYVWWGYEDLKLFDYAKDRLTKLSSGSEPFNFTMLTVDTHFEDGYVCDLCGNPYGDNQYANVISCSSAQIAEFVSWIQQQDFYENTTVILSGDHLTMDSDFCTDIDENYNRSTYNVILNSPVTPVKEKNRVFTTMDLFPTTLASLGVSIEGDRLGLGTNLFSETDTLAETIGFDALNENLEQNSRFFEDLTSEVKPVWEHDGQGWTYYIGEENRYARSEWVQYNTNRVGQQDKQDYYIGDDAYMVTGWQEIDGSWYYFNEPTGYLEVGPVDEPFEILTSEPAS